MERRGAIRQGAVEDRGWMKEALSGKGHATPHPPQPPKGGTSRADLLS